MSAIDPTRRFFALVLGSVLLAAVPTRAGDCAAPSADAVVLAHVDGGMRPITLRESHGGMRLNADAGMQLGVVDLAEAVLPATAVDFTLERAQHLRLEVLDLDGKLVRTIAQGLWAEGRHQLAWQHDAESGDRLAEGLFVVRLVPEAAGEQVALAR